MNNNYYDNYTIEPEKIELAKGLRDNLGEVLEQYTEMFGPDNRYIQQIRKTYEELDIQIRKEEPEVV